MSRRRRKNPLLGRILVISIVVHVIAIPILAKFGAFEKIRRQFMTQTVTVLPTPPEEKPKEVAKKAEPKKQVAKTGAKSQANRAAQAKSAPHPPVVAANASSTDTGEGPTIDANGTGKVGVPPNGRTGPDGGAPANSQPQPHPQPQPQPEPKPQPQPEPRPEPKPEPKPHVPVLAAAEPTYQPQPEIPDDLRAEALDATCVVDIAVGEDGSAQTVKVSNSSGTPELDQIAVSSAKKWRFKPATRDGEPIQGTVRLHVRFKVD